MEKFNNHNTRTVKLFLLIFRNFIFSLYTFLQIILTYINSTKFISYKLIYSELICYFKVILYINLLC